MFLLKLVEHFRHGLLCLFGIKLSNFAGSTTYWKFPLSHGSDIPSILIFFVSTFNPLRPRQNGHRFADDTFKCIFLNENVWIHIKISLRFVPKGPINNIPAMVQIMAWRRPGDKPLSKSMLLIVLTHICVTRPQWFNIALCRPLKQIMAIVNR